MAAEWLKPVDSFLVRLAQTRLALGRAYQKQLACNFLKMSHWFFGFESR
jgi:hypothetical protein